MPKSAKKPAKEKPQRLPISEADRIRPPVHTVLYCARCRRATVEVLSSPEWWARINKWEQQEDGTWVCHSCLYVERTREQATP
jgi:hypothetical protein